MIFDVMIREGFNEAGKQIISVSRIRDISLNSYLRKAQDEKKYIISVIPLFRHKRQDGQQLQRDALGRFVSGEEEGFYSKTGVSKKVIEDVDPIDPDAMIDPHGF